MSNLVESSFKRFSKRRREIASRCKSLSYGLTLSNSRDEPIKRALISAADTIDAGIVSVHDDQGGMVIRNAKGKGRYMTLRERLAFWLLGNKPEIRP